SPSSAVSRYVPNTHHQDAPVPTPCPPTQSPTRQPRSHPSPPLPPPSPSPCQTSPRPPKPTPVTPFTVPLPDISKATQAHPCHPLHRAAEHLPCHPSPPLSPPSQSRQITCTTPGSRVRGVKLAVVGAGSMGAQIAQQAALHGMTVMLHDKAQAQLRKAAESNRGHLARRVEKGKLSQTDAEAALRRVVMITDLAGAVQHADFVIEAVFEDLELKCSIFRELDRVAPPDAVLASNSSTIGISKLAGETKHPERCINMHFFYPVLVMDLVEIVRGPQTS